MKAALCAAAAMIAAFAGIARADESVTVQSLIGQGFTVTSSFMTPIGPGMFLQKAEKLYLCFVHETATSKDVSTNYCKPVH